MSTELLETIRKKKRLGKIKQVLVRTRFTRIGWLVREYRLREDILADADHFLGTSIRHKLAVPQMRIKKPYAPPPFILLTREEYDITLRIMERIDSAYLDYVTSPEEIILAGPLHRRNPFIKRSRLVKYHFETLLLCELAREEVRELANRVASLDVGVVEPVLENSATADATAGLAVPRSSRNLSDKERAQLNLARSRMDRLLKFIARVDGSETEQEGNQDGS